MWMTKTMGYTANDIKVKCIHLKMMALDYQPLSVISDVGFTSVLITIDIPSRKYFTDNVLPKINGNIDTKLAEKMWNNKVRLQISGAAVFQMNPW